MPTTTLKDKKRVVPSFEYVHTRVLTECFVVVEKQQVEVVIRERKILKGKAHQVQGFVGQCCQLIVRNAHEGYHLIRNRFVI